MPKLLNRAITLLGESRKVGGVSITLLEENASGVTRCKGATVPTDAATGYDKGCVFTKISGGVATTTYINEGSASSADFNAVESSASTVTSVTAGNGLTGGGTEGAVSLAVAAADGSITVAADAISVANAGVTAAKLGSDVDGNGLVGGNGAALAVGVEIYNNTGSPLTAGTLVTVGSYVSTSGVIVSLANSDTGLQATHVVTATIPDLTAGTVYPYAVVTGLNTGGKTIGDFVYLSTAGAITYTAPTGASQIQQAVGTVKVVNAATGEIVFFPGFVEKQKIGTAQLQDSAVTNAKVADSSGVGALGVAKSATVLYDFSVDGGTAGTIALAGSPSIPDNAVVWVESYDVITTCTSATDAATIAIQLPTDGLISTAIAISAGSNPWDLGVYSRIAGGLATPLTVKTTAARVPSLLVAGGENLTAGKIVFQLRYWVSA